LKSLWLDDCELEDISVLKKLKNLEELIIHRNPFDESQIQELRVALPNCKVNGLTLEEWKERNEN